MCNTSRLLEMYVLEELGRNINEKTRCEVELFKREAVVLKKIRQHIKTLKVESPDIDPASIILMLMTYFVKGTNSPFSERFSELC